MDADTTKAKEPSSSAAISGRWWESYLVRYFIGTLLGSVLIAVLGLELQETLRSALHVTDNASSALYAKDILSGPAGIAAIAIAGLAFCYVSSAPITVIHATRMDKRFPNSWAARIWFGWAFLAAIIGGLYIIFHVALPTKYLLLFMGIPAAWVGAAQYVCVWRIRRKNKIVTSEFVDFYVELSLARQRPKAGGLRESYTHLREHSNSIFIVAIELSLASLLMAFIKLSAWDSSPFGRVGFLVLFVLVWIIPNVFLWGRANALEAYLRENPSRFDR